MKRVQYIANHLSNTTIYNGKEQDKDHEDDEAPALKQGISASSCSSSSSVAVEEIKKQFKTGDLDRLISMVPVVDFDDEPCYQLAGPHMDGLTKADTLKLFEEYRKNGEDILLLERWARKYSGNNDIGVNLVRPGILLGRSPLIQNLVIIGHPNDCERIASVHVKKSVFYLASILGEGVLSTTNVEQWSEERKHLSDSFLPISSLRRICGVSVDRARYSVEHKLMNESKNGTVPVEMNEFFLFEAMAQLHLALLGEDASFMEKYNVQLRKCFNALLGGFAVSDYKSFSEASKFVKWYSDELIRRCVDSEGNQRHATAADAVMKGCPVQGPLAANVYADLNQYAKDPKKTRRDTMTTFTFAGHDTTANLMTWFTFEMARRPDMQKRLQNEIDGLYSRLAGDLTYDDLSKLPVMTSYIRETLRLWPSVPNGTFRELALEEEIEGLNGKKVRLPKGTQVQIAVWPLHHNEKLWGNDVNDFNPDREWLPEEKWDDEPFAARNPSSYRYSPFTYSARDCMGKNFAQMESRVILFHLFLNFNVTLANPTLTEIGPKAMSDPKNNFPSNLIKNHGTMGPKNGIWVNLEPRTLPAKIV